jgi:hypothetical protein
MQTNSLPTCSTKTPNGILPTHCLPIHKFLYSPIAVCDCDAGFGQDEIDRAIGTRDFATIGAVPDMPAPTSKELVVCDCDADGGAEAGAGQRLGEGGCGV